jgi:hypothetical protein
MVQYLYLVNKMQLFHISKKRSEVVPYTSALLDNNVPPIIPFGLE